MIFQSWLRFVHSVQFVHTMAIHPNTQVGSKLFLCSTGRGICHLQAKLSKLHRQRGTTIHTLKPQAMCYWAEPQQRLSHLQTRKYTPVHSSSHKQPLTKTSFPAFTLKIAMNLHKHRGSSLKESTFIEKCKQVDASKPSKQPYCSCNICCRSRTTLPSSWSTTREVPPLVGKPAQSEFLCPMKGQC